jgi:hypothetical protein
VIITLSGSRVVSVVRAAAGHGVISSTAAAAATAAERRDRTAGLPAETCVFKTIRELR